MQLHRSRAVAKLSSCLQQLIGSRRGSATVELVMIAPVFILMVLITIELGVMLYTQSVLDGAARIAARQIRTGQVQAAANPLSQFLTTLCSNASVALNCANIVTDVESFGNFSAMQLTAVKTDKTGKVTNNAFTPGNPNSAVAVRVFYTYNFIVPWVALVLNPNGNGVVLQSTVVFQNEPFPTAVSS